MPRDNQGERAPLSHAAKKARFFTGGNIHVEDQLQIGAIDLAGAPLQRVVLLNCKTLTQIEGLDRLDALAELRIAQTQLDLDPLVSRDWPPSTKVLSLRSGNRKRDEAARAILAARGYREFGGSP